MIILKIGSQSTLIATSIGIWPKNARRRKLRNVSNTTKKDT